MSEKKEPVKLTPEEWAEFREAYLKAFETMPRAQAYAAAVREMRLQNKPYPSFRTLYNHLSGKRNTTSAAPSEKVEAPKAARPSDAKLREENRRLKKVLRLYRFCREIDRDAVCDLLLPDLAKEDEE